MVYMHYLYLYVLFENMCTLCFGGKIVKKKINISVILNMKILVT